LFFLFVLPADTNIKKSIRKYTQTLSNFLINMGWGLITVGFASISSHRNEKSGK